MTGAGRANRVECAVLEHGLDEGRESAVVGREMEVDSFNSGPSHEWSVALKGGVRVGRRYPSSPRPFRRSQMTKARRPESPSHHLSRQACDSLKQFKLKPPA